MVTLNITLNIKPMAVKFMIFLTVFALFTACAPLIEAFGNDLYKLCSKCGLKIPKNEDGINKFDINFCPACGNDLKKTGFVIKSAGEKVLELIKQKRRQIGDVRQLKASEWADKGETSEDKIMKMACFINSIELDKTSAAGPFKRLVIRPILKAAMLEELPVLSSSMALLYSAMLSSYFLSLERVSA